MANYQRIRDLREDSDKTQSEIAKELYMQREVYRRYETGEREPPFNVMIALARIYKVSLDYIAGLTNDKRGIGYNSKYNITNNGTTTINIKE
ncbi:MAG: helix-turn-helix transcriptional regulator [Ruminococcus sp.]|nr:helix-turn-helix transcriptional regulator [Ruminococcus sp.]